MKHTPQEVASTIKGIVKQKYAGLNDYAKVKNISPTQLYSILSGKEYMSLFSAFRFFEDFDINSDYCTKGELPVLNPDHDYNQLLEAATGFFYAVRDEDNLRDEYDRKTDSLSEEEKDAYSKALKKLRIEKAKAGCELVDLLNKGWAEENPEEEIQKPVLPENDLTLHKAIVQVIREGKRSLSFTEIAKAINQQKLYSRKDGKPVPASQICARVKNYPQLFTVNSNVSPATVSLNKS